MSRITLAMMLGACARQSPTDPVAAQPQVQWVELALSSPEHLDDWQAVATGIAERGIETTEGPSSLGTQSLLVHAADVPAARELALDLVQARALTIRIKKDAGGDVFEVFVDGLKAREESYAAP